MSQTHAPGTLAVATVRGVPNVRIVRVDYPMTPEWMSTEQVCGRVYHGEEDVTDVRPLVVLDLALNDVTPVQMSRFVVKAMHDLNHAWADHIADQFIEQTKPPRIPEPTGFAPVVEAGVKQHDLRLHWSRNEQGFWFCKDEGEYARNWGELVDPVLIRDGIEDQP